MPVCAQSHSVSAQRGRGREQGRERTQQDRLLHGQKRHDDLRDETRIAIRLRTRADRRWAARWEMTVRGGGAHRFFQYYDVAGDSLQALRHAHARASKASANANPKRGGGGGGGELALARAARTVSGTHAARACARAGGRVGRSEKKFFFVTTRVYTFTHATRRRRP